MSNVLADWSFAYNATIECPPFSYLYPKIPVLSDDAAFKAGLNKLKVLGTFWRNLGGKGASFAEKMIDLARNLVRASPIAYDIIKEHCPEWHNLLHPRGGKVPTTYLGKQLGEDVLVSGKRLATQVGNVALKTLEKEVPKGVVRIITSILGTNPESVTAIVSGIGEKLSNNILMKLAHSPQVQWGWIAGWIGLFLGSLGYALLQAVGANDVLFQSWMEPLCEWWYDVPAKQREYRELTLRLDRARVLLCHQTIEAARRAGASADGVVPPEVGEVCAALARKMKTQVHDLDLAQFAL